MDQDLLVAEQIEAGGEFLAEFQKTTDILAAFWLKIDEVSFWYLHVAADEFQGGNLDRGYGEVLRIAGEMRNPYLNPFRVKLIHTSNQLAKAAIDILQLYSGRHAFRTQSSIFGGMSIDEVYVYPLPVAVWPR